MNFREIFKKPFAEQVEAFRDLLQLPLTDWRDLEDQYRQYVFYVSGMAKADLVAELYRAVESAIAEGRSIEWFREQFDSIVSNAGWGAVNPKFNDPGYRDWRARLIYTQNLQASYSLGRWTQLNTPALNNPSMVWVYFHSELVLRPRELHLAWGSPPMALPAGDPWFAQHYPPRGIGCQCYVIAMRREIAQARGYRFIRPVGEGSTYRYVDRETGLTQTLPLGVDPGFGYTMRETVIDRARELAEIKTAKLPPALAAAVRQYFARGVPA